MNMQAAPRLTLTNLIGYGLGDMANNFVFAMGMIFLLNYYTDTVGISAAAAGSLLAAVRIYNAVTDIVAGRAVDRTVSRWGRCRPFLLWGALPLLLLNVMVFSVPGSWSPTSKLVYACTTYGLLVTAYSFVNIPYGALATVMTQEPRERARLGASISIMAVATACFLALVLGPILRRHKLATLDSLAQRLGRGVAEEALAAEVTEALTTNETSFFRDGKPFEHLKRVLPQLQAARPAGHRLRLALATSYWPTILPSPTDPGVTVDMGSVALDLPLLGAVDEIAVPEPENPDPLPKYIDHFPGATRRRVIRDLGEGRTEYHIHEDTGVSEVPGVGMIHGEIRDEIWSIRPGDPQSMRGHCRWEITMRRGDWSVRTLSEAWMECTETDWLLRARVTAWEGDTIVSERDFDSRIPRDLM